MWCLHYALILQVKFWQRYRLFPTGIPVVMWYFVKILPGSCLFYCLNRASQRYPFNRWVYRPAQKYKNNNDYKKYMKHTHKKWI